MIGNDLGKLLLNKLRISRLSTNPGQGDCSLLDVATLDEVTRGVWKEEKTGSYYEQLNGCFKAKRSRLPYQG
jgi:hypothetical protein